MGLVHSTMLGPLGDPGWAPMQPLGWMERACKGARESVGGGSEARPLR